MATLEDITSALKSVFPDIEVNSLEQIDESRILGIVVSATFEDVDYPERQEKLWTALELRVSRDALKHVGPIAVLTPEEAAFRAADVD